MESGVEVSAVSSLPIGDGSGLSERDLRILEFERQWWRYAGAKEQAIRELFGCSTTRYYQMLNTLIDDVTSHKLGTQEDLQVALEVGAEAFVHGIRVSQTTLPPRFAKGATKETRRTWPIFSRRRLKRRWRQK